MWQFIRLLFSAIGAIVVTLAIFLGINAFLLPQPFLYTDPEDPEKIYFIDRVVCDCTTEIVDIFVPPKPDTSNQWTDNKKASPEPPDLPAHDKPTRNVIVVELSLPFADRDGEGDDYAQLRHHPAACLEKGAQGEVIIRFDVSPLGKAENIEIISSPDACFNEHVIMWVQALKFRPLKDDNGDFQWQRGQEIRLSFIIEE